MYEEKIIFSESLKENFDIQKAMGTINLIPKFAIYYKVEFINEGIFLYNTKSIELTCDIIDVGDNFRKSIKESEIVMVDFNLESKTVEINLIEVPEFITNQESNYPKFDIRIIDNQYSMRVYATDSTYLDIPTYQSHDNIIKTLEYISELVTYNTVIRPGFFNALCANNTFNLSIISPDAEEYMGPSIVEYRLYPEFISIKDGSEEVYNVEYHKFFKLVMDNKWIVEFCN